MQQRTYNRFVLSLFTVGLLISIVGSSGSAQAQTTSNGPYYATPSWDQTLPAATRFIILSNFNSEAVLDRNTGLVWEKSPRTPVSSWTGSGFSCLNRIIGGQKGWRLPVVHELASLIDPSQQNPALPPGHPFLNISPQVDVFWSATTRADDPILAWGVDFIIGQVIIRTKTEGFQVWCVRGGGHADAY